MIRKERKLPLTIEKLRALLRRLPATHMKYRKIEVELAKRTAGYRGEQSLDYYLSVLPEHEYLILHDLRLKGRQYFFQMDTLILSHNMCLILEVKHISGELLFDQMFHQLIRSDERGREVFPDPILQAKRQAAELREWLELHKYGHVPVDFLVVMTNPKALLESNSGGGQMQRVVRSNNLPAKMKEITQWYPDPCLSKKDLNKLSKLMIKEHEPDNTDILQKFQLQREELLTGVHCPKCNALPMKRERQTWMCPHCHFAAPDAYLPSARDYALLVSPLVSNSQLRVFLQLPSSKTTQRILQQINISYTGQKKTRVYKLPL